MSTSPSLPLRPQTNPPNTVYTDTPKLHPNLILGSIHLIFWILFHPTAWKNHITKIDSTLPPDFALSELNRKRWHNPYLRRLLFQIFIIVPFLISVFNAILFFINRLPGDILIISIVFTIVNSLVLGSLLGMTVGVAVGTIGSMICGMLNGFIMAIAIKTVGPTVQRDMVSIMTAVGTNISLASLFAFVNNVAIGATSSILFTPFDDRAKNKRISFTIELGAVVIGIFANIAAIGLAFGIAILLSGSVLYDAVYITVYGIAIGGAVVLRTHHWRISAIAGIIASLLRVIDSLVEHNIGPHGMIGSIATLATAALSTGLVYASYLALPYAIARRVAGSRAGAVAGIMGIGSISLAENYLVLLTAKNEQAFLDVIAPLTILGLFVGLTLPWWRPVILYPFLMAWNTLLYHAEEWAVQRPYSQLRWHTVFWDELQRLPLTGLDEHLVLVVERYPAEGQAAMDYVATSRQHWAAQQAQIELDARVFERCTDVTAISRVHRNLAIDSLPGPASALLRSFSRISQDVAAALEHVSGSAYNERLAFSAIEDRLDSLVRELTRSDDRYARRFRRVVTQWHQIINAHVHALAATIEQRQEIDSPYIIGVPLSDRQEIFVGRTDISARIEVLLRDQRHPPLLLYGQRRMGKTSLLNNLGRLLPSTILPLFVDLMGPVSLSTDQAGFLYGLSRAMIASAQKRDVILPLLSYQQLRDNPFIFFDEWLDEIEHTMNGYGRMTALLILDEFEVLESVLKDKQLSEAAVLGTLRHIIQHRPRFKVLLAGSHTFDELRYVANYLINAQLIHISYLSETETRKLVENPIKDFLLRYNPDAYERVFDITHGHPFLVQLLCREIVALKNTQTIHTRRIATHSDVDIALLRALRTGSLFFRDIEHNQVDAVGRALLQYLASYGEGAIVSRETLLQAFPDILDQSLASLIQRECIEATNNGYRFQVKMIQRWFAQSKG